MPDRAEALLGLGLAIRHFRASRGLSQEALAARAGLHRTYIGGIERGERNPTFLSLNRLANALDVSLVDLSARVELDQR